MKNTISKKYIEDYILNTYGKLRHNPKTMAKAIRYTAKEFDLNCKDLFHYIIEGTNTIPFTKSYGFDTGYGREIKNTFSHYYYYYL